MKTVVMSMLVYGVVGMQAMDNVVCTKQLFDNPQSPSCLCQASLQLLYRMHHILPAEMNMLVGRHVYDCRIDDQPYVVTEIARERKVVGKYAIYPVAVRSHEPLDYNAITIRQQFHLSPLEEEKEPSSLSYILATTSNGAVTSIIGPNDAGIIGCAGNVYDVSANPVNRIYGVKELCKYDSIVSLHPYEKKWIIQCAMTNKSKSAVQQVVHAEDSGTITINTYPVARVSSVLCTHCGKKSKHRACDPVQCGGNYIITKKKQDVLLFGPHDSIIKAGVDGTIGVYKQAQPFQSLCNVQKLVAQVYGEKCTLYDYEVSSDIVKGLLLIIGHVYQCKDSTLDLQSMGVSSYNTKDQRCALLYNVHTGNHTLVGKGNKFSKWTLSKVPLSGAYSYQAHENRWIHQPTNPIYPRSDFNFARTKYVFLPSTHSDASSQLLLINAAFRALQSKKLSLLHVHSILKAMHNKTIIYNKWELLWRAACHDVSENSNYFKRLYARKNDYLQDALVSMTHCNIMDLGMISNMHRLLVWVHDPCLFPNKKLHTLFKDEYKEYITVLAQRVALFKSLSSFLQRDCHYITTQQ